MNRIMLTMLCLMLSGMTQANSIYKCISTDKIVFSQHSCPKEFLQHKIEYQLGITTEIDSDQRVKIEDPLRALLKNDTISKQKLLQLLDSEVYRLQQENNYYQILRAGELQKLERNRYWQKKEVTDSAYLTELKEMQLRFDHLIANNNMTINLLDDRKQQIEVDTEPGVPGEE